MIKAVLFDLDNTLIDFMRMKKEASRAAAYAMVEAGLKADKAVPSQHKQPHTPPCQEQQPCCA